MRLQSSGYRAMVWKNGQGITHEIAREPALGDAFLWRLSIAEVAADGDFSLFPGADRTITDGYAAARACALTQLAVLKRTLGSLDKVREVISVNGYVNAIAGFPDSPAIINGASDLLIAVFEDQGRHVRAAVGVSALPRNALVELQMVVAI